jgi:hypothetical protein
VRTRLRRALAQLRERFDGEVEGGRHAWVLALAPLAYPPSVPVDAPTSPRSVPWKAVAAGVAISVAALILVSRSALFEPGDQPRTSAERHAETPPRSKEAEPVSIARGDHSLEILVLARGRPWPGARVALAVREPHPWRYTPFDRWEPVGETRTDDGGVARFEGLGECDARAFAAAPGFARGAAATHLPSAFGEALVIDLRAEDPWEIQVTELGSGRPVAGAEIELRESPVGPVLPAPDRMFTSRDGLVLIPGVRAGQALRVRIEADRYLAHGPVPVDTTEPWRVDLERCDRRVRWPVQDSPEAPPDGAELQVRRVHEPVSTQRATVLHGEVFASALPAGEIHELLAIAPDGSFARLSADALVARGEAVRFARPPRLTLMLRDSRGDPVPDAEIAVHDHSSGTRIFPGGVTDGRGRAVLPIYAADEVEIRARADAAFRFLTLGAVEPGEGDVEREFQVPAVRSVTLTVGPEVPDRFELYAGRERLRNERIRIDRHRGTIAFPLRRDDPVRLHLLARGFVAASPELDPSTDELTLQLERAGELVLPVLLADANQPYRLELVGAAGGLWRGPWRFRLYPGPDRVVREAMIPEGSYRVRDGISGVATPVFRIAAGDVVRDRFLDLSRPREPEPEMVQGWVEAYPEIDLSLAVVEFDGGHVAFSGSAEVARDGSFRFEWRGSCKLSVRHPSVDPQQSASVELAEPREDVLLKLTPWNRAFARLDPVPGAAETGGTSPRVVILDGGRPISLGAVVDGAEIRFAGHRAGRADLWIDVSGYAPGRIRDALLRQGTTDLGTLSLRRGTSLALVVRQPEDVLAPELLVTAQALGEPRYQRSVRTGGETRAKLDGLGAGAFLLRAFERDTGRCIWSKRIEVDGATDREIEIDLR